MKTERDLRWTPFVALLDREIQRFLKVIVQTVITPFVSSVLYLLIFGVSLGRQITMKEGVPYLSFLIPGLVMMGCLNNAFQNSSSSVVTSKFSGDLEDLKVAPLSFWQIILALSVAGVVRGLIVGGIIFLVGEAFHYWLYSAWLLPHSPVVLLLSLLLGGLTFANVGISVAFWARTFDQMSAVSGFILTPLIYLGGVFFSIEGLPEWVRKISLFNPLLYMINGVRYGVLGRADVDFATALGVATAAFLLTLVVAINSLRRGSFQRW